MKALITSKYRLSLVTLRSGKQIWKYTERGSRTGYKSTGIFGKRNRWQAERFIADLEEKERKHKYQSELTVREYFEPYYDWDFDKASGRCPYLAELRDANNLPGPTHIRKYRGLIERFILEDNDCPISDLMMNEVRRVHILELRSWLRGELQDKLRTVKEIMSAIKVVFLHAYDLEVIDRDPTARVRNIKYERQKRGAFTSEEIGALFPSESLGPWEDQKDYAFFLMMATTGMRPGELRALTWDVVSLKTQKVEIKQSVKAGISEVGNTKTEVVRPTFLISKAVRALQQLPKSIPYVFGEYGEHFSDTWIQKRFRKAMKKSGLDEATRKQRRLTPYSFRHSFNTILEANGGNPMLIKLVMWGLKEMPGNYTDPMAVDLSPLAAIMERAVA